MNNSQQNLYVAQLNRLPYFQKSLTTDKNIHNQLIIHFSLLTFISHWVREKMLIDLE